VKKGLIVVFLFPTVIFSQMLDNRSGKAFTDVPFFSVEFIRANSIKQLNGQFTYKKSGDIMRLKEYKNVYEFDTLGRLIRSYETKKDDGTKDTTSNVYVYSEKNLLISHKKGDQFGFSTTTYAFDSKNRVTKEVNYRDYRDSLGAMQRIILNTETMVYEDFENQTKKTIFNSYGLPYLQEFSYYNEFGYLIERVERLLVTSEVTSIKYAYNSNGWIAAMRTFKQNSDQPAEEIVFTYDENGNLLEKHIYRDSVFTTEIEVLYNDKSKLITYVLTRDVATNFIHILTFKTLTFF
jgi:YD repeat-containing protein